MDAIETISTGRVLEVRVTGKLTKEAYQEFGSRGRCADQAARQIADSVRHAGFPRLDGGRDVGGSQIRSQALEGHRAASPSSAIRNGRREWPSFCKPFTKAKIRYFDVVQLEEARAWLEDDADA